uniref:Protein kinase domain-containing protein n=1 Tax=Oryza barthii TaxID=65489 RepID=A0A0D3FUR9_9ORYZ
MMKVEGNAGFTLYDRQEIETATNNFNKAHIIGEGGQGTVYRAVLGGVAVAIKMCKEIDESRKMEFVQELVILCRVNHPNIVKLLGCCLQFEAPMLVYEFVQNKTLQELLDLQRSRRFHVTLGTRLRIAAESTGPLAHLHSLSHPILHGDVKPANILLAEGLVAKVSDFGCSTINENTQAVPKGTPGYIDPNYILEYQLTAKNDVYSFGVILLELLTGKMPLSKERKSLTSMFQEAMVNGTLLELLDNDIVDEASMRVIHRVAVLASQCLVVPGTTRPAMALVEEELRRLALADEVQRYPQPPLVLDGLSFVDMGSTMSIWYDESKTSGVYSLENKALVHPSTMTSHRGLTTTTLCLAIAIAAELLAERAEGQCQNTKCGDVEIPYPFSTSLDKCVASAFEFDCNDTGKGVYKPFYGNVEVLSVSLQLGQVRVMNHISSSCYNISSKDMDSDTWELNMTGTPFMLSDYNKFTILGCRTLAYIADQTFVGKYMSGCVSVCRRGDVSKATNGTCSGIGCCQTAIPKGLDYYQVFFDIKNMNTSGIYNRTPCSYAVLMDSSNFTFSTTYLTSSEFNNTYGGRAPMVLDWAIRSANTCEKARKKMDSYACRSTNSECFNSANGPGYICNCSKGYEGNPYLGGPNGCRDIDECQDPNTHHYCYGECRNNPGGFDCNCPPGSKGNATIPDGCRKDFSLPLKARLAIGRHICFTAAYLVDIHFPWMGSDTPQKEHKKTSTVKTD